MIIFSNGDYEQCTDFPDNLYDKNAKYCVPDNSELAAKIKSTPYWKPVEDENGKLVDIIPVEAPITNEEKILALKNQLEDLDKLAIRPLRAIATGTDTDEDREKLADLEQQAAELRQQLDELEG
ncbi:MAG: hypothetical protein K2J79_05720 [Ruminiclostridium sp.]|nr:hypothetical protein [Ruminiclostridium sp.]